MKTRECRHWCAACVVMVSSSLLMGGVLQLGSIADSPQGSPTGGSGDSWAPKLSSDGRFVLFASTADNLVLGTNGNPYVLRIPAPLNLYLRDRTNQTTTLVSVSVLGGPAGPGDSIPVAISTNGRYALFESSASGLVAEDTNAATDVFVRDLASNTTILVSANTNGVPGNGASRASAMTPDGRFVAFVSESSDLVPGDTNGIPDVFVRDLQRGATLLVSVGATSTNGTIPVGGSAAPEITPDGRSVAFFSTATNLVPGAPLGGDLYVRDVVAGQMVWASAAARGMVAQIFGVTNAVSFNHALSADGQYLAYEAAPPASEIGVILRYNLRTGSTDIVSTNAMVQTAAYEDIQSLDMTPDGRYIAFIADIGGFSNSLNAVQIWDGQAYSLVSASLDVNGQAPTNSLCDWPTLDPSGRLVTFLSTAANLVTNATPGDYHLYLRDLRAGTTTLLDADTNGAGSTLDLAAVPCVSADASLVAFACLDSGLVPNDRNRASDVFVREPGTGVTELVSAHDPALASTTPNGPSTLGSSSVSEDGTMLAFESEADNLVANDTNRMRDVFVRDLTRQTNLLVSANTNGFSGDGLSSDPAISSDGRYVAFASYADDLVPNDGNQARDVFIRDLRVGTTTLISVNASSTGPGNGDSYGPLMGANGRYVLFRCRAQNLGPPNASGEILILRDWQAGTNYLVSPSAVQMCAMTPDASRIVYVISLQAYVWDLQAGSTIYTSGTPPGGRPTCVAISADGSTIAVGTPGGLAVANVNTSTSTNLDSGTPAGGLYATVQLSGDGRLLVASKYASTTLPKQIYLYDMLSAQPLLLSHSWNSTSPASADSDSPQFSPDGRFVAYHSFAADLLPGAGNSYSQVFLFDRQTGTTSLLSVSSSSGDFGSGSSTHPVFSADGQTIWFQSAASDLVAHDLNESGDLFAFALISAGILPPVSPGEGPWLSWRYFPGQQYRVQFKDDLSATSWQDSIGTVTNNGAKAFFQDPAPGGSHQRFYRVVGF